MVQLGLLLLFLMLGNILRRTIPLFRKCLIPSALLGGALLLMVSVFAPDEQTTRKWLLGNAIIWTVYTAIVGSTAFFTDLICAFSTSMALYKYRKKKA